MNPPPRREERRPRDMALSLAVLIVPIALLLVFYRFVLGGDSPANVDPGPAIQEAQAASLFTVSVPDLNTDWHVSSATFRRESTGATLRLGYTDPDDDPVQLVESSVPAETLLPVELTSTARPTGTYRTTGRLWKTYEARPGEQALVLGEPGRTVIVIGKTSVKNLQALAAALS